MEVATWLVTGAPGVAGDKSGQVDAPRLVAGRVVLEAGSHHGQQPAGGGLADRFGELGVECGDAPRSPGEPGHPARAGEEVSAGGEPVGLGGVDTRDAPGSLGVEGLADEPGVGGVVEAGVGAASGLRVFDDGTERHR